MRAGNPALRLIIGTAVSVALLIAAVAVIILRLHHPAFGVSAVAVTGATTQGCTVTVTGRIDTTGGAGTVSYEWLLQPQQSAPKTVSQPVAAGQNALYVTAAVQGLGHGTLTETATLKVLGPGQASQAATRLVVSC